MTRGRDGVAYLTIEGREAPLAVAVLHELEAALARAQGDGAFRSIVISGRERDLVPGAAAAEPAFTAAVLAVLGRIDDGAKRVYAAIGGAALGAAFEIVLACDGLYAGPAARFGFTPAAPPTSGSRALERLTKRTGAETARAMLEGEPSDALEGYGSELLDGILVNDLLDDVSVFARREAALPRGRYDAASNLQPAT